MKFLWLAIGIAVIVSAMTGCSTPATTYCPPLRTYSPEFNARLADEVGAAPADAVWPGAILDYTELRDRIRAACQP